MSDSTYQFKTKLNQLESVNMRKLQPFKSPLTSEQDKPRLMGPENLNAPHERSYAILWHLIERIIHLTGVILAVTSFTLALVALSGVLSTG